VRLIALEEHLATAHLIDQVWGGLLPEKLATALIDVGEHRLRVMDAAGIDVQVLSATAPGAQHAPVDQAAALAAALNDRCAQSMAAHPDRFQALAAVPTQVPAVAAVEAKRAITELGFCGVIINGHTGGRFLDAPEFDDLLGTIEELSVPLYLHPTFPPPEVAKVYFDGLEPMVSMALATGAWGWHAETGLHVLRLAATGVFDRHPGLQVVIGHMGENLPFSLMRADAMLTRSDFMSSVTDGTTRSIAAVVLEHVFITICGYTTVPPLLCALSVFGADRILFSTDYPFDPSDPVAHARFLAEAPISPADREKIAHGNAEQLFRLQ
jgi:predicted TIM-barrel fold metal-dependent hydrolase